jgi:DNA-binding NtrC family response regulator
MDFAVRVQSVSLSLVVMSEEGVATIPLPSEGEVVIGRSTECDVRLEGFGVSRKHLAVRVRAGARVELVDLGSRNGTFLADRHLVANEPTSFSVGETARIGDTMLVLQATSGRPGAVRFASRASFEVRFERELRSAGKNKTTLALLRVSITSEPRQPAGTSSEKPSPEKWVAESLRPSDLLSAAGPRDFEAVLVDVTPELIERASQAARGALEERGFGVHTAVAVFPKDGTTREILESTVRARLAPEPAAGAPAVDTSELKRMVPILERVASGKINVLILGETGVGKEVLAHAIHSMSPRAPAKIVCLNCCALTDSLHESELFGHERGAFTGAVREKVGLLETANGGTVFLDEVGEMSLTLQAKFLRVLEQKEVTRVGGLQPRPIDVRIVAATNRDLEADVQAGRFRSDLFFRLNGVTVVVPPLRDRVEQIEGLALHFIALASKGSASPPPALSPEVLELLKAYAWPGNIRELRNLIERAVLLCTDGVIRPEHLPLEKMGPQARPAPARPTQPESTELELPDSSLDGLVVTKEQERARIIDALRACKGNQTKAAEMLQISRRTLVSRITEFGLPRPRKQP